MGIITYSKYDELCIDYYDYRGEGNAHVALSLCNRKGIILIKKVSPIIQENSSDRIAWLQSITFHNELMHVLLSPFVEKIEEIQIDEDQVAQIQEQIDYERPIFRREKILSKSCHALITDYTTIEDLVDEEATFAFEIKPKAAINIDNICRFCWKQQHKLDTGRIGLTSKYCPKELFSGDHTRMYNAVTNLLDNPQNNLQIFKNSQRIFDENNAGNWRAIEIDFHCWNIDTIDYKQIIVYLIVSVLQHEYKRTNTCKNCMELPEFTVLHLILSLQNLNDDSSLSQNHSGYVNSMIDELESRSDCNFENEYGNDECLRCSIMRMLRSDLRRHYISKIARDCSIMIAIKRIPPETSLHQLINVVNERCAIAEVFGTKFMFRVNIMDLFPKPEKQLQV